MTLLGTEVDDEMRGRVFALLQSLIRVVLILALAAVPFSWRSRRPPHVHGRRTLAYGRRHPDRPGRRRDCSQSLPACWPIGKMDDGRQVPVWADLNSALRGDSAKRRRMEGGGVFIAFEGGEGSGKSTQIGLLGSRVA